MILHQKALLLAKTWKQTEAELVAVLIAMQRDDSFVALGFQGVFTYCQKALGLSDAQSFYFQKVVQTSLVVPKLEKAVTTGELSVSQARRIAPVLTETNASTWIEKAKELPQRELEKAVASVNPNAKPIERMKPVSAEQVKVTVTVSPKVAEMLRRIQDLESQRTQKAVSLDEALEAMAENYLERKDPVRKAERAKPKSECPQESTRAIPAAIKHAVVRRDKNQCVECGATRWLEIHHKKPLAEGGLTIPENLLTLCSAHHRHRHEHSKGKGVHSRR